MKNGFKIEGMRELQRSLKKLGEVPQKHVTASVKKGMNLPLKAARADAPKDTGNLARGIIKVGEKTRTKGKKVYRIVFNKDMNDIFQKTSKSGKTSYYPVSQEYGWKYGHYDSDGTFIPTKIIPGQMFVHGAFKSTAKSIEQTIVTTMKKKIDEEIAKAGLK